MYEFNVHRLIVVDDMARGQTSASESECRCLEAREWQPINKSVKDRASYERQSDEISSRVPKEETYHFPRSVILTHSPFSSTSFSTFVE